MQARAASRQAWIRALDSVARMRREPDLTLPAMIEALALEHGERTALLGAGERLSYAELARRVASVAGWGVARAGSVIGLLMPNRPDYVAIWLGLSRAGCAVALLNPSLAPDGLNHAVRTAGCVAVIADPSLRGRAAGCGVELVAPEAVTGTAVPPTAPAPGDTALLVFTSGTTGLAKAARVTQARVLEWALWFAGMIDLQEQDRIYVCLPLYHSTGGIAAIGAALVRGGSVLIAPGFSARRFWDDVADGECSVFFYIGELCRYLVASPAHPRERAHRLRLAVGNGLQGGVWQAFQARFGVPQILEFYAATEGGVSLYNCEGVPGAIGRVPPFLQSSFPLALVRVDPETGEAVRGADGLCVACGADEAGEAVGRLGGGRRFDGYTDAAASARKVLRDVSAPGDRWFRSGDLMRRDAAGFYYFVDRMGDTFRWKGENVSTLEVATVVRSCPGVADALVYGVRVPGHEGRAGMAAVVPGAAFDLKTLAAHAQRHLPSYARPVFVRTCAALAMTGTFKLSAAGLAREGFACLADPVWFLPAGAAGYVACDGAAAAALANGSVRL